MTKPIAVVFVNHSSVVDAQEVARQMAALQTQVSRDFGPLYGIDARLTIAAAGQPVEVNSWVIGYFDNSDQAGALGYHDVTAARLPLGKVFAATDRQYGSSVSVTASHELLEMLHDPWCRGVIRAPLTLGKRTRLVDYADEVGDAVEADTLGYFIGDVRVSDFVLPAWYDPKSPGPYDFLRRCSKPLDILPGGYVSYRDSRGHWHQHSARQAGPAEQYRALPKVGSRRERRRRPLKRWIPSELR